jgi:hypothetical protein
MERSRFLNINWGDLGKGLLIAFLTALLGGVLELLQSGELPVTWAMWAPIFELSLAAAVSYLLKNMFTNSEGEIMRSELSAERKRTERASRPPAPKKKRGITRSMMIVILLSLGATINAQSKWDGFFKPVTADRLQVADRSLSGAFLFRPAATIIATEFRLSYNDEGFDGIVSSPLSKAGIGVSYAHYIMSGEEPFNDWSVNGMLMFPTNGNTNMGLAVTVSALRYINLGLGYDFIKGSPFRENLFFLTGVQYTF